MATAVMGQDVSMPVLISPTGVQAVHPDGEVAVARAAADRGVARGLSSFGSKPIEEVVAANPQTFFQKHWVGTREDMLARMDRAKRAGAGGLIGMEATSRGLHPSATAPHLPPRTAGRAPRRRLTNRKASR